MTWFLVCLAVFGAMIAIVVTIGALLSQSHVATRTVRYAKTPAELFAVLADFPGLPTWRKGVKKIEVLSPTSWRENGELTLEVQELDAPRRLVTRIAPGLPFGGTWTYEVAAVEGGAALTITEHGEVYNPLFRFVSRFLMGHTATIDGYLKQLGAKFGQTVKFE